MKFDEGERGADSGMGVTDRSTGVTGLADAVGVTGRSDAEEGVGSAAGVTGRGFVGLGFGMSVPSARLAARLRPRDSRLFFRKSFPSFFGDEDDGLTPKATASLLIDPLRGRLPSPDCRECKLLEYVRSCLPTTVSPIRSSWSKAKPLLLIGARPDMSVLVLSSAGAAKWLSLRPFSRVCLRAANAAAPPGICGSW